MSEEEREIDVELDDGGDSGLDTSSNGMPENKRALHNAMERKRRDSIKDSFRGLQECIPTLRGDKTSRAQVLKKTGDYISHMQKKINTHQDEIRELKNQNAQLESQIRALEKAKATGNFVSTAAILEADNLVSGEDLELDGINGSEIVYDDTSSDASDSTNGLGGLSGSMIKTVSPGSVMAVSLPTVPGVTVSLPTLSPSHQLVTLPSLNTIQPGQSLLANNIRVQPGQSLLLSEPMRKKMKF